MLHSNTVLDIPLAQESIEAVATALSSLCGGVPVLPLRAGISAERQAEEACVAVVCHGACAADAVRTRPLRMRVYSVIILYILMRCIQNAALCPSPTTTSCVLDQAMRAF